MIDWSAVALLLAERAELPAVFLSGEGEVLLVASAAERALGWKCDSVGGNWVQRYVSPGGAASAQWFFEKTLSGALRHFDVEVITPDGAAVASFESYSVGQRDRRGVLLLLETVVPTSGTRPPSDYDYEVSDFGSGAFKLQSLWRLGTGPWHGTGKCYEVLHQRSESCAACPLLLKAGPKVRMRSISREEYELTSATVEGDHARLTVRRLPVQALTALLQVRLEELAMQAQLSQREADVLRLLVDGRSLTDIATALGISARTVKFHQANLLQKLGVDSRADLVRLVL
jgi:DNA-binding CsgD family transcriptional regulator